MDRRSRGSATWPVALVVQVLVFLTLRVALTVLVHDIAEDRMGPAMVVAVFSTAAGILSAASMLW